MTEPRTIRRRRRDRPTTRSMIGCDVVRPGGRGVRRSLPARRVALDRRVCPAISRACRQDPRAAPLGRHDGAAQAAGPGVGRGRRRACANRLPSGWASTGSSASWAAAAWGSSTRRSRSRSGRHVALKVIPRHGLLDAKRRQRFQREAMAVAQLHHTNIVPIFAVGEHDGLPYYAMQYIRGSGLDRLLEGWRRDGLVPRRRTTGGSWRGSASRPPRPSSTPTTRGSCTATSSRPTC